MGYATLIQAARFRPLADEDLLEATEQDRARIVQCAPVRRLQQKTQVFPLDVKASVRSRLTHSLEVQETGRQLTRAILRRLPAGSLPATPVLNLVEMACLLHDVGNPPFGHFGEAVIREWLVQSLDRLSPRVLGEAPSPQWVAQLRPDLLNFDGNAQSLRLVHSLQGLNLTLSQLAALIKYPRGAYELQADESVKAGYFFSERGLMAVLRRQLGLQPECRHPLVYLMEAADDIAYCVADLDDAVDRGLLSLEALLDWLRGDPALVAYLEPLLARALASEEGFFPCFRHGLTLDLVVLVADTYLAQQAELLAGRYMGSLLNSSALAARTLERLRSLARQRVFGRREVEILELEGYAALRGVLETYGALLALPGADFQALGQEQGNRRHYLARRLFHRLPPRHLAAYRRANERADPDFARREEQEWYFRIRLLLDFVSGMTDTYVQAEYRLLSGI